MKSLLAVLLSLKTGLVLAHPGHGKQGLIHFHEFSDGLIVLAGLVVAGLLYWAWKK